MRADAAHGEKMKVSEGDQFKFEIVNHENNFESGLTTSLTALVNNKK